MEIKAFVFASQLAELTQLLVPLDAYKKHKRIVFLLRNVKYANVQKLGSFQVAQQKYN